MMVDFFTQKIDVSKPIILCSLLCNSIFIFHEPNTRFIVTTTLFAN